MSCSHSQVVNKCNDSLGTEDRRYCTRAAVPKMMMVMTMIAAEQSKLRCNPFIIAYSLFIVL